MNDFQLVRRGLRDSAGRHERAVALHALDRIEGNQPHQLTFGDGIEYYGTNPTGTEQQSGQAVKERERGPLRKESIGHFTLRVYKDGGPRSAYHASWDQTGDWHKRRREPTRLQARGYLEKTGTTPSPVSRNRRVDLYQITPAGVNELHRLDSQ